MPYCLFHDGFGQYDDVLDLNRRGGNLGVSGIHVGSDWGSLVTTGGTRSGAKKWDPGTFGFLMTIDVEPAAPEGVVGYRGYITGNAGHNPVSISDINGQENLWFRHNADFSVSIFRGDFPPTELVRSPINALQASTRPFIEFKFKIHASAGLAEVRVNSQVVCTFTGDTLQGSWGTPSATWRYVVFAGSQIQPSDIYVADSTDIGDGNGGHEYIGEAQTDWHGGTTVGANDEWTPSGGPDSADDVDDIPSDQGASFTESSTPTERFTVEHENLKNPGAEIVCVTDLVDASKPDPGASIIRVLRRQNGVDYESVDISPNEDEYNWVGGMPRHFDPDTGVLWVEADFNNGEIGALKMAT